MPVDAPPAVRWSQKARQVQQAHFRATANKLAASFDYLVATGQLFKPLETHWCVYADPARKANPPPPVTGDGDGHRQFRPSQDTFRQSTAAVLPAPISIPPAGKPRPHCLAPAANTTDFWDSMCSPGARSNLSTWPNVCENATAAEYVRRCKSR